MTITPDAPQTDVRMIDGIPLTPKEVTTIGFEDLVPKATIEEERLHRKQRLAGALRIFGRFGFGEGVAGHITVRDPEFPDHFWVNPLGLSFRHMRVSDLILVNHHGEVVYGKHSVNRAAYVFARGSAHCSSRCHRGSTCSLGLRQGIQLARHST